MTFDAQMEQQLREAVEEWQEVLGRQVTQARQIVTKLLTEKLTFTPEDRDGRRGFRFEAAGTVEKLIAGVVPGLSQAVMSPTGFEHGGAGEGVQCADPGRRTGEAGGRAGGELVSPPGTVVLYQVEIRGETRRAA